MRKISIITLILLLMICCAGCTVQFKAKELELDGHVDTYYQFNGFAWTELPADLDPPSP